MKCPDDCGPGRGFCDRSAGACMCRPGWRGPGCAEAYLGACRTSVDSLTMACEGFSGIFSCRCKWQCWQQLGLGGVKNKPCFERIGGSASTASDADDLAHLSDIPQNLSDVHFRIRFKGGPVSTERAMRSLGAGGGRERTEALAWAHLPLPNARCPGECSYSGTCFSTRRGKARCLCHAGHTGKVNFSADGERAANEGS